MRNFLKTDGGLLLGGIVQRVHTINEDYYSYQRRRKEEFITVIKWLPPFFLLCFGLIFVSVSRSFNDTSMFGLLLWLIAAVWLWISILISRRTRKWFHFSW